VVDYDDSPASRQVIGALTADGTVRVVAQTRSEDELRRMLDAGEVRIGVIIPRGIGADVAAGEIVPMQVLVDGTDATFAGMALSHVGGSIRYQVRTQLETTLRRAGVVGGVPGLHARPRVFYNEALNSTWFIIPALIAIIVMLLAAMVTSQCVAREYEQNTIEQVLVSPVGGPALMVGKLVPYIGVGTFQVLSVILAAVVLFQVPIRGSLLLLATATLLFLTGSMALGLMLSAVLKSQQLSMMVAFIATMLPSLLLSGFVFPLKNMPWWLQAISYVVPARYYIAITRGLFLKDVGLHILWPEYVAMVVFALILVALAVSRFRRSLS